MAISKKKPKVAVKAKSKKAKTKLVKKVASKLKPKKSVAAISKKKTVKSKATFKKVALKKTAKKKLKSLGKSKVNTKIKAKKVKAKKNILPFEKTQMLIKENARAAKKIHKAQETGFQKTLDTIQKETKAVMKPFGDLAVAIIDTVDDAISGTHHAEAENE